MDNFKAPRSVKTAAMISQIILIVWAWLLLFSSLFQNNIVSNMSDGQLDVSGEKVVLYSAIIMCIANVAITAANALISKGKAVYMPLTVSAAATAVLPGAVYCSNAIQTMQLTLLGVDKVAQMSIYASVVNILSWPLYGAAIMTIAASAVYAYAKNHSVPENEKISETEPERT
ncbi:hypothetical protein [Huintestinicola sp.]|uniref:hypothetical protein n=1 Tax=Huintestinicola sp. TaxID=2981661 RepID=UPI003D7DAF42